MKVTLINHTHDAEALLVFTKATRLSMSAGEHDRYKQRVVDDPEWVRQELAYMASTIPSSWEMVDYVFMVEGVSRAYTHQQVRTRAASYAQQSLRVVDAGDYDYVFTERNLADQRAMAVIQRVNAVIRAAYAELRTLGQPPEDARGILPTNIATNIVCKFDLRTLSELAKSRTGGRTQNEYQRVVNGMCDAVLKVHPWAEQFLFPQGRDAFKEIEEWAARTFPNDLLKKGELLKIVDRLRKNGGPA